MQEPHHSRNFSGGTTTFNGGALLKRTKQPPPPLTVQPGSVAFRLLCHASRVGGVIGKSGAIIKQLQQETSAKIRIEDSFPNSEDHRVIVVIASASISKKFSLNVFGNGSGPNGNVDQVEVSPAQEAVVRVFERVIEVAAESDGIVVEAAGGLASCRLLAHVGQVGSVIGKGGKVVETIRKETGCRIRVLTSEKFPGSTDEIVEIEGDILAVKRALVAVTRRMQDCPPAVDKARITGVRQFKTTPQQTLHDLHVDLPPQRISVPQPTAASSSTYPSAGCIFSSESDRIPVMDSRTTQEEVVYKLLCPNDRVGGVIGKGGSIVKALQAETGASIIVGPTITECDERLITISAIENPDSRQSAAQNAVILVFNRLVDAGPDSSLDLGLKGSPFFARLVVPSNQVGCLLGKGGAIISDMRKMTGAGIRIIIGDQVPKCCSENDEVTQITGEFVSVRDALYNVIGRLRDNLFRTKLHASSVSEGGPYERVRDNRRIGYHPPTGVSQNLNHNTLTQRMDNLGINQSIDQPTSPRQWSSQMAAEVKQRTVADSRGQMAAEVKQRTVADSRGLTSVKGGVELGSGSRTAIVTNTTVEIIVPENVIGSVYGENGCNLVRLRQISGAKVRVHEPQLGTTERIIVISGSPDEAQAAQSLLQAFILTGSS